MCTVLLAVKLNIPLLYQRAEALQVSEQLVLLLNYYTKSDILKLVLEYSVSILFLYIFEVYSASCSVNISFLLEEVDPNP